jgi:hypothetical protein
VEVGADVDDVGVVDVVDTVTGVPEDELLDVLLVLIVELVDVLVFEVEIGAELLEDTLEAPGMLSGPGTYFVRS